MIEMMLTTNKHTSIAEVNDNEATTPLTSAYECGQLDLSVDANLKRGVQKIQMPKVNITTLPNGM